MDEERFEADQLHLIGFGLGAHVVGFAGRGLGGRAARITGKNKITIVFHTINMYFKCTRHHFNRLLDEAYVNIKISF